MKRIIIISIIGFLTIVVDFNVGAYIKAEEDCRPSAGLNYICGPTGVEDLIHVPGTRWIIGSGMGANNNPGKLHLIDTEKKSWDVLYPHPEATNDLDTKSYPECTQPPDAESFVAHGIALRDDGNSTSTLLSVNHGREAIEVFRLNTGGEKPSIRWTGCVPMDENIYVNSVSFLPDEGMIFTRFFNPQSPSGMGSIMGGEPILGVYEWHAETGIQPIPGTELSGANGIVASNDGRSIYVAAWGAQELVRFTRQNGAVEKAMVKIDYSPDNLRWAPDGRIFVTGQSPVSNASGGFPAFKGWVVSLLDPESMKLTEVLKDTGDSSLQNGTVAIDVNGTLWIGSFQSDRIAYKQLEKNK